MRVIGGRARPAKRSVLHIARATVGALAFVGISCAAHADTNWTDGTGDWLNPANWDNGIPTAGVTASITNGGLADIGGAASANILNLHNGSAAQIQTGGALTVGSIDMDNGGALGVDGTLVVTNLNIHGNSDLLMHSTANVTIGILQLGDALRTGIIGFDGSATVSIANPIGLGAAGADIGVIGDVTISQPISGTGHLTVDGLGQLILTGNNTYSGGTTVTTAVLLIGNRGTTGSITGDLVSNVGVVWNRSDNITFSGNISGTGYVQQSGAGILTLTGNNTYTGETDIDGGGISISSNTNISTGLVRLYTGVLQFTSSFNTNRNFVEAGNGAFDTEGTTNTLGGNISTECCTVGGGGLIKVGSGSLILTGINTYTGATEVDAGTLVVASEAQLGSSGQLILGAGTNFKTTASATFNDTVKASGDPTFTVAPGMTTTWAGQIFDGTSAGTIEVAGGGTFHPTNAGNSYSGGIVVKGGSTVVVDDDGVLGAVTGGITLGDAASSGTLRLGAGFNISGSRPISVGAGGATIDTNGFSTTISQGISGGGSLTKEGVGTLTLTGTNTYSGGTTIVADTLQIGSGGTTGSIVGNVVNNANLVFDRSDNIAFAGNITGSGGVSQIGLGMLTLSGANTYANGTNVAAGTLVVSSDANLGNGGTVSVASGATLQISQFGTFVHNLSLSGHAIVGVTPQTSAAVWLGLVHDGTSSGTLDVTGGGTLFLGNVTNLYSGGTIVRGNAELIIDDDRELGNPNRSLTLGDATSSGALAQALGGLETVLTIGQPITLAAGGGKIVTGSGGEMVGSQRHLRSRRPDDRGIQCAARVRFKHKLFGSDAP